MTKWLNCFMVVLVILLTISHAYAESSQPTKTVKIFLQSVTVQDKNAALGCTDGSAQCEKLVNDFMTCLTGWPVNSPATFEMIRILEEPRIRLEKIASDKAKVIVDCAFAFMGGHLATKEITKEKYSFSLVNRSGVWIIISGRTVSSTSLGYKDMNKLPIWNYAEQKCQPLYETNYTKLVAELNSRKKKQPPIEKKQNVANQERKRKEHLADELGSQEYVKTKTKYLPLMRGWSKDKVASTLGPVLEPKWDMWNYEFDYLCFGKHHAGGVLDIYFIDNKVYKVLVCSSSIGYSFGADTLDPKLARMKFDFNPNNNPYLINGRIGDSWVIVKTGCSVFAASDGKIRPGDSKLLLNSVGSFIWNYYEVPWNWQGVDMRLGVEITQ